MTEASYCAFEVLWETEFACAKSSILETTSCVLSDDSVHFNMTKLAAAKEDDYQVYYNDTRAGSTTQYIYYINVCHRLSFPCEGLFLGCTEGLHTGQIVRRLLEEC